MGQVQIRTFVEYMMLVQRLKAEVAELRQELERNRAERKPSSGMYKSVSVPGTHRSKKAV